MDDVLYYILITVGSIAMFVLNSWAENKRKKANTPPPIQHSPNAHMPQPTEDDDDSYQDSSNLPGEPTWQDVIDLLNGKTKPAPVRPKKRVVTRKPAAQTAPTAPTTPVVQQRYIIESPEQEGASVTNAKQTAAADDHAYDLPGTNLASEMRKTDWRRAVIAHEILKRKF